jgi:L-threonylcarbamoyladenylate synthase
VLKVEEQNPSGAILEKVSSAVKSGGVVILPTETVYGLVGDVSTAVGLERILELKKRGADKPISIFVNPEVLRKLFPEGLPELCRRLADRFWPGPLTLIVPYEGRDFQHLTSKTGKIGLRSSASKLIQGVLEKVKTPLSATSANLSGEKRPYPFEKILKTFSSQVDLIVKAQERQGEKLSTVLEVEAKGVRIIREGAVPLKEITDFLLEG